MTDIKNTVDENGEWTTSTLVGQVTEDKKGNILAVLDTDSSDHTIEQLIDSWSIRIYTWTDDNVKERLKEQLSEIDFSKLKNTNFVLAEFLENGGSRSDFLWIQAAFDIYTQEPEKNLVLMSVLDIESIKKINRDNLNLEFLLNKKNVKFLDLLVSDGKLLETLFEPDYLSSISFNFGIDNLDKEYELVIKEEFKRNNLKNLKDVKCFFLEWKYDSSSQLQNFKSIDFILNELAAEPDKKIIIFTTFHLENLNTILNRKSNEYKLLLNNPNVRFFRIWEDIKKLENIFDKENNNTSEEINTEVAFQNIMESEISRFLHDSKYWIALWDWSRLINEEQLPYLFDLPEEKKNDKWIEFESRLIAMLQMQHPSFKQLPRDKNLQRIVDMYKYSRTKGLPEWTRFEGVFVDRDWTLYDNKNLKFNQKIIDMIKDYEKQWKKIIIRTWWNLEMKQKLLDEIWLDYKIENKTDYKWWTVEIAIDNDPQEFLLANAKIKSETHIKV